MSRAARPGPKISVRIKIRSEIVDWDIGVAGRGEAVGVQRSQPQIIKVLFEVSRSESSGAKSGRKNAANIFRDFTLPVSPLSRIFKELKWKLRAFSGSQLTESGSLHIKSWISSKNLGGLFKAESPQSWPSFADAETQDQSAGIPGRII